MAKVELRGIVKKFGKFTAVKNVDLTAKDREFLVLVGPSGCGKTTTLRMISGLDEVTEGQIYIGDRNVTEVPPKDRDVAMVFQNYALYPHMTVYKNIAFGLQVRKFSKAEIEERVRKGAQMLGIEGLLDRKPRQLSGGQRQRVAMGRAIVRNPQAFLFDEPLSNLDAKLRTQMRAELKKLHQRIQTTVVYVTHDQVEAMTLADRIVIMKDGVIMQIGTANEVYHHPENLFVADFIGNPSMNFLNVDLAQENGSLHVVEENFKLSIPAALNERFQQAAGRSVVLGIRPEHIYDKKLTTPFPGSETLEVKIEIVEPVGSEVILHTTCGSAKLVARVDNKTQAKYGASMELMLDMNHIHIFDKKSEKAF
ncbi:MAG: sn-glycerol-3-phosphate ABC transporter ATP-binding protein UgpC [Desulfobacterales bacterium]|jgi:multiple sugar transport system ATP-binding protein